MIWLSMNRVGSAGVHLSDLANHEGSLMKQHLLPMVILGLFSGLIVIGCGESTPIDVEEDAGGIPRPDGAIPPDPEEEDLCEMDNGGCDPLTACSMSGEEVICGACPDGYAGDGYTGCEDIDECAEGDPCFVEGSCVNTPGSFTCAPCPEGMVGDGIDCIADPCEDVTMCAGQHGQVVYEYACMPLFPEVGFTCRGQFPDWSLADSARFAEDRFEILSEQLARDRLTGLVWQRYAPPQSERTPTYANAKTYCANLTIDGEGGFRLPEIAELESLIDERQVPAINTNVFPNRTETLHWSASKSVISPNTDDGEGNIISSPSGWTVRFDVGMSRITPLTTNAAVRCVR